LAERKCPEKSGADSPLITALGALAGIGYLFSYIIISNSQSRITQKVYSVANRPYLGVVGFIPKQNLSENGMDILVVIKNSGTVSATKFGAKLHMFVDGVESPQRTETPDNTRIMIPGGIAGIHAFVGSGYWGQIVAGRSKVDMKVEMKYDGPDRTYAQCDKAHYDPEVKEFVDLGETCGK